jgi:hypothetical protein
MIQYHTYYYNKSEHYLVYEILGKTLLITLMTLFSVDSV